MSITRHNEVKAAHKPEQEPAEFCDLVMKGGITSGIVYPSAIFKLKETYYLRKIGGTSAGAIAAGGTAAAELGRHKQGFEKLHQIQQSLAGKDRLLELFQPEPQNKPLLNLGLELLEHKEGLKLPLLVRLIIKHGGWGRLAGLLIGLGSALILALIILGLECLVDSRVSVVIVVFFALLAIVLSLIGLILGAGWELGQIARRVATPTHFYGLATGFGQGEGNLTNWMHLQLNYLAGLDEDTPSEGRALASLNQQGLPASLDKLKDKILTFGDLAKRKIKGQLVPIELKMVTTNLSHGQPYILPDLSTAGFIFRRTELEKLFPPAIVNHLVEQGHSETNITKNSSKTHNYKVKLPDGYHFLPATEQLPVVFAMRLSLSFPLLICAVPLYTIKPQALERPVSQDEISLSCDDLQRNWFTDGGICSNFPIHFFDAWLPSCPTFGITLINDPEHDPPTRSEELDQPRPTNLSCLQSRSSNLIAPTTELKPVYLPKADAEANPAWQEIGGIFKFAGSILSTSMNYRENMQASLPSYRDRIVQIRLYKGEGGLNLRMDETIIKRLIERGTKAGELLHDDFNLEHHRWVRFRVLMAQLQLRLDNLSQAFATVKNYQKMFKEQLNVNKNYPYACDNEWCERAEKCVTNLYELLENWKHENEEWQQKLRQTGSSDIPDYFFLHDSPLPRPTLRVIPEI